MATYELSNRIFFEREQSRFSKPAMSVYAGPGVQKQVHDNIAMNLIFWNVGMWSPVSPRRQARRPPGPG